LSSGALRAAPSIREQHGQAVRSLSTAQQLIFLLRRHGELDGKSIGEFTASAEQTRALGLAQSWAAAEFDAT